TRGHPHGRGAPGPARRLGHHPSRHHGPPAPRSARRHAADPAPAVGASAPAPHGGDPAGPCLTRSRTGATRFPLATTTTTEHMGGFFYGYHTTYDTLRGHHRPHSRAVGTGHRALATAVGPHHGGATQPLQPAALSWHQRLALDSDGRCVPVLGD